MKIQSIQAEPKAELKAALEKFEAEMRYPLGTDSWFRISHGEDYTRFFRAIGQPRCFIATRDEHVVGTITSTICRLRQPGGSYGRGGYISDLKVSRSTSGLTLLRLLRAATDWTLAEPTPSFCVVMEGTARSPINYTGRLGIPEFTALARLVVLRIPVECLSRGSGASPRPEINNCASEDARRLYERLTLDCFATDGGQSTTRSRMPPLGLIAADGSGSGVLEDTRRGKRLFRSDDVEMVSAHLSCFGFRSIEAGATIIRAALQRCASRGVPALFVCVRPPEVHPLLQSAGLQVEQTVKAPATVFGYAMAGPGKWSINTAEI